MTNILIVEDEPGIAEFLEKGLRSRNFAPSIASNAQQAFNRVQHHDCDLMILDLSLPGKDGLNILEHLRSQGKSFPIIILTARDNIEDKLAGLEGGANDYMTKPFQFEELVARIRLRLRDGAAREDTEETLLSAGNMVLDLRRRIVKVEDRSIELATREYALAEVLFRAAGQVVSREELLNKVWGYNYDPGSNIVEVYIGYLRKKMGSGVIGTVRGVGYRLLV
ncbi:transcriptional regulator [Leptolyngbya sp. Heron Island J]|uniref:response regulator transcription factor n=1 Tax=Leptolyngbya sp. Heron Island J TaxID=1385935 RepID=UPI0003B94304|nr:response regulator transcription factor [Leptolyngbya sp. Heron Island J]ESA38219.1 transcriptional regulator [Leptolyngbya sp. Heron Island J]